MELRPIGELLPQLNGVGTTPLWYEREEEQSYSSNYVHYRLYAQLSDKVAVYVNHCISDYQLEADIEQRERYIARLTSLCSFDELLLTGNCWVTNVCLKAFAEVASPYLPVLQVLREQMMAERKAEEKRCEEEEAKQREEEAKQKLEEERKERERLIAEAAKCRDGKGIAGCDVVELCRLCGINIHLRTVHNLQQVIVTINGKERTCQYYRQRGNRKPQLDGCYDTASKLYHHLQEHYDELNINN